jgi:hypothetical protein
VSHEICHGHLATQYEGHGPRQESQPNKDAPAEFEYRRSQHHGIVEHGVSPKCPKELLRAVAGEQERDNKSGHT